MDLEAGRAPSLDAFRKPVDVAVPVTDRALRRVPAQPAPLVAIDDDRMISIVASFLFELRGEELVYCSAHDAVADIRNPDRLRNRFVRQRHPRRIGRHAFGPLRYVRNIDEQRIVLLDELLKLCSVNDFAAADRCWHVRVDGARPESIGLGDVVGVDVVEEEED